MTRGEQLQASAGAHLMMHFAKQDIDDLLVLERGEGPYVFDTSGKRYVDALSSLFCAQIGYSYGKEMAAASQAGWSTTSRRARPARRSTRHCRVWTTPSSSA